MLVLEKYKALIGATEKEDHEFIYDAVDAFRKYVNSVIEMELRMPMLQARCIDTQDYQERVMSLDKKRRSAHNCAIDSCNMLNRLSVKVGLTPFFEDDVEDRYQVADFALQVVTEVFVAGQHKSIEDFVQAQEYVPTLQKE